MARNLWIAFFLAVATLSAQDGAQIYKARCAQCHDQPAERVPPFSVLQSMDAGAIRRAIDSGTMRTAAEGLSDTERNVLVAYIAKPASKEATAAQVGNCSGDPAAFPATEPEGSTWSRWGMDPSNSRFQKPTDITAGSIPKLKLKWAFGLGEGIVSRSQPAVAAARLFIGTNTGTVSALDASSGCTYWTFNAGIPVRTGIVFAANGAGVNKPIIYFGDQAGNIFAVDAVTGKSLWKIHADSHPAALITGTPQYHDGVLYAGVSSYEEALAGIPAYECCKFRGSVIALDAATGKELWRTYLVDEPKPLNRKGKAGAQLYGPSGIAVWSTPTIDDRNGLLYVSTGDNYSDPPTALSDAIVALDRKTGRIVWSKQFTADDAFNNSCSSPEKTNCPESEGKDFDLGQPPILVSLGEGKRALVVGQKSGVVHAIDPDREGAILWQTRVGKGGALGGIQWGSAADGENMYVALSDLELGGVPDKSSPVGFRLVPNPKAGGGLFALRLTTGETVWKSGPIPCAKEESCSPSQSAAVTAMPSVVFSGSMDGHLRAYSTEDGKIIWDFDTAREYPTVNGQQARGGALDATGPVIAGGMLYVNSGYGQWGALPGNVLLAFSVDGK